MVRKSRFIIDIPKEKAFIKKELHVLEHYFEKATYNRKNRAFFSIVLAFFISLFSQFSPICTQDKCYHLYIELITKPSLLFKPFSISWLTVPFLTSLVFFAICWFVILSIAIWVQRKRVFPKLFITGLIIFMFFYTIIVTSGAIQPLALQEDIIECVTSDDCIRAGYCGEVCASVYRPVYTTHSEDCTPLNECVCLDNRCVGS